MDETQLTLYHFTDGGFPMEEGLKAQCTAKNFALQRGKSVVWFTTEEKETWWENGEKSKFRLTVVIPSADKRLVRYAKWMKKNFSPERIQAIKAESSRVLWKAAWKSWYVYSGDVLLSKLRAVEYADSKRRVAAERAGHRYVSPAKPLLNGAAVSR